MRAIQVREDLTVRCGEVETPRPGPGEALVRVHAAGVCGTDLHIMDGMIKPDSYPMTLGHEAAGVVEETGPGAAITAGTRVAVFNKLFCGACAQCLLGRQNLCTAEPGQLGFNRDGGISDGPWVLDLVSADTGKAAVEQYNRPVESALPL